MNSKQLGTVYLIHLESPLGEKHKRRHYVGFTTNLDQRIAEHRNSILIRLADNEKMGKAETRIKGTGSKFLAWANVLGIQWRVVTAWENVQLSFEKKIKRSKNYARYCPECNNASTNKTT